MVSLPHLVRLLKDTGGLPAHGNQRSGWDAGCRYDFDDPDYRCAAAGRGQRRTAGIQLR